MSGKPRLTAKQKKIIKEKLCELLGKSPIIEIACQKVDISRMTLSRWRKDDPSFSKNLEDALSFSRESINDLAESKMIQMISEGNASMIRFWSVHNNPRYKRTPDNKNVYVLGSNTLSDDHFRAIFQSIPESIKEITNKKRKNES